MTPIGEWEKTGYNIWVRDYRGKADFDDLLFGEVGPVRGGFAGTLWLDKYDPQQWFALVTVERKTLRGAKSAIDRAARKYMEEHR